MATNIRYSFVIAGKLEQILEAELDRTFKARRVIESVARRLDQINDDDVPEALSHALDSARELLSTAAWELDLVPQRAFPSRLART